MIDGVISYAQNAEDVVLWRLFRDRREPGFFIDVGAAHPVADSVTKWFSVNGWRGINIEPVEYLFDQLVADRPDDINLRIVCGAGAGTSRMTVADTSKWGHSTIDPATSASLSEAGLVATTIEVETLPLSDVIDRHAGGRPIDFLKIDVEGAEDQVLLGADLGRTRPRVLVVEAVEPDSLVPSHERWEHLATDNGYVCVLFDGLSRFYCQADDAVARETLSLPAYYGDHFITNREYVLRMTVENLRLLLPACAEQLTSAIEVPSAPPAGTE